MFHWENKIFLNFLKFVRKNGLLNVKDFYSM